MIENKRRILLGLNVGIAQLDNANKEQLEQIRKGLLLVLKKEEVSKEQWLAYDKECAALGICSIIQDDELADMYKESIKESRELGCDCSHTCSTCTHRGSRLIRGVSGILTVCTEPGDKEFEVELNGSCKKWEAEKHICGTCFHHGDDTESEDVTKVVCYKWDWQPSEENRDSRCSKWKSEKTPIYRNCGNCGSSVKYVNLDNAAQNCLVCQQDKTAEFNVPMDGYCRRWKGCLS